MTPMNDPHTTEVVLMSLGREVKIEVDYKAHPAEAMTRDHPGAPAEMDILAVRNGGKEDVSSDLTDMELKRIEDAIWKQLNDRADWSAG
jgi:hypothetical protein